jgi:hypothetical protein
MVEQRFAFDLELIVVARLLGFDRFAELPVRIERRFGSTISVRAVAGILADTFSIWWRLRVTHQYGGEKSAARPPFPQDPQTPHEAVERRAPAPESRS